MSTILFLCPHGAAKSILAAAYCQRLAAERGLEVRAVAAGIEPDPDVAPAVARALLEEGIDVRGHRPRRVAPEELTGAWRMVSLGCELGDLAPPGLVVDRWDDVPSPSAQLEAARGLIAARLPRLLDEYERAGRDPDGSR
jgi:protein-tyrosine-phosphatase